MCRAFCPLVQPTECAVGLPSPTALGEVPLPSSREALREALEEGEMA